MPGSDETKPRRSDAWGFVKRPSFQIDLQDPAVSTDRSHMAGRIEEPEPLPFVDQRPQVLGCVKQLLHASLGSRRVDRNETANRGRKTSSQQGESH